MRKIFTLLAFAALFSTVATAQLADGTIAPDWTLTDINGNEHTLYSYLDQGYSVVLDFSATWCGPCWSYHTSGALEDLYINHGPAGMANVDEATTDNVMVFMIEGDGSTTDDELHGIGATTQGDWVTGTPYPIIDDDAITTLYAIGYWPTIYTVCPDRTITESSQVGTSAHYNIAEDCGFAAFASDMRMVALESPTGLCGTEYVPTLKIQNLSTDNVITSATISASQGGTDLGSFEWTGSLETYDVDVFDMLAITGINTDMPVSFAVSIDDDLDNSNDAIEVSLTHAITSTVVTLDLTTDDYGSETSWDVKDASGATIASGSGYGNNTLYTEDISLPAIGCFNFNIYDSYGDGICCSWGDGSYELKDEDGNVILSGGEFANEMTELFENDQVSGIEEISAVTALNIYPNPVTETANLSFGLLESLDTKVEIFNLLGERVLIENLGTLSAGSQLIELDFSNVESGVYFVSLSSEGNVSTKRVTVTK